MAAALLAAIPLAAAQASATTGRPAASCEELQRALERMQKELEALQRRALADGKLDPAEAQALAGKTKELQALAGRLQACLQGGGARPPAEPPAGKAPPRAEPPQAGTGPARLPRGTQAARLARAIVKARTLAGAEAATRQALAWGGVTVRLGGRVYARGRGPSGAVSATPLEALHLAVEARERESVERLTLAELGRMLRGFRFPFGRGDPGAQLAAFVREWIAQARRRPRDPRSFTPLFLAEMARLQRPAVDLARGEYRPGELRLTLLEGELLAAAFLRGPAPRGRKPQAASALAAGPCSEVKELVEKEVPYLGEIAQSELQDVVQDQLRTLLEKATGSAIDEKDFGKAMQAAEIALLIQKLVALYGSVAIEVYPDADSVHKPTEQPNVRSARQQRFEAVAGLTAADWERYTREIGAFAGDVAQILRALKDCLGASGVPMLTDLGDIADEVEKWHVKWDFQASPNHARLNVRESKFDFPGQRKHKLKRRNVHSGHAFLVVDVQPERESDHPGRLERAQAVACAQVDFSQPPSTSTFTGAAKGGLGLAKSIVELAAGWIQALVGPRACEVMEITYHVAACPGGGSFRRLAQEAAAPAVCQISGTFGGAYIPENPYEWTVSWRGEATFVSEKTYPGPSGATIIEFKLVRGTVTVQGRGGSPCRVEFGPVTITRPLLGGAELVLRGKRPWRYAISITSAATVDATVVCPDHTAVIPQSPYSQLAVLATGEQAWKGTTRDHHGAAGDRENHVQVEHAPGLSGDRPADPSPWPVSTRRPVASSLRASPRRDHREPQRSGRLQLSAVVAHEG